MSNVLVGSRRWAMCYLDTGDEKCGYIQEMSNVLPGDRRSVDLQVCTLLPLGRASPGFGLERIGFCLFFFYWPNKIGHGHHSKHENMKWTVLIMSFTFPWFWSWCKTFSNCPLCLSMCYIAALEGEAHIWSLFASSRNNIFNTTTHDRVSDQPS